MSPTSASRFSRVESASSPAVRVPHPALRMPRFMGTTVDVAAVLAGSQVGILCTGSVGRLIATHAARLQPRRMWLVDDDVISAENVLTQDVLMADVGGFKALETGRLCKAISPATDVWVSCGRLEKLPLAACASADLLFLSSDNLAAEVEAGQRAAHLGVPLVQAAVYGDALVAKVLTLTNAGNGNPCPMCLFGQQEMALLDEQLRFSCSGEADESPLRGNLGPTMSTSYLCAMAASLAVLQGVRLLAGMGAPVGDTLLTYTGYTHATTISPLRRRESCPCDHVPWARAKTARPIPAHTPRELLAAAGVDPMHRPQATLRVEGYEFAARGECCGVPRDVRQFITPRRRSTRRCDRCGRRVHPLPFDTRRDAPMASVPLDARLDALGARHAEAALVTCGERTTLITAEEAR
jgi:molybdopterin/thiamine biosynthesis adenylyltransferase